MEQTAKERACRLAARHGVSLFTRGLAVYGVSADGHEVLVCRSRHASTLWARALMVLSQGIPELPAAGPRYRLVTSAGVYEADSAFQLLVRWVLGRTSLQGLLEEQR